MDPFPDGTVALPDAADAAGAFCVAAEAGTPSAMNSVTTRQVSMRFMGNSPFCRNPVYGGLHVRRGAPGGDRKAGEIFAGEDCVDFISSREGHEFLLSNLQHWLDRMQGPHWVASLLRCAWESLQAFQRRSPRGASLAYDRAGSILTLMSRHLPCRKRMTLSAHRVMCPMRMASHM